TPARSSPAVTGTPAPTIPVAAETPATPSQAAAAPPASPSPAPSGPSATPVTTSPGGATGGGAPSTPGEHVEVVDPSSSRAIASGVLSLLQGVTVSADGGESAALGKAVQNLCVELVNALPAPAGA